jgi:hypothetical protein
MTADKTGRFRRKYLSAFSRVRFSEGCFHGLWQSSWAAGQHSVDGPQISMTECSGYENNIAAMLMQRRDKAGPERVNRQNRSYPGSSSPLLESSLMSVTMDR